MRTKRTAAKMDSLLSVVPFPAALETAISCPKIAALVPTWKTCGKPACNCNRGNLHGPYWSLRWREGAVQRRRYVRLADVAAVRTAIDRRRAERVRLRMELAESASIFRALKALYRELDEGDIR